MKPWFVWRGIDSRNMGIVVESLPPIRRPEMRVDVIEVDGRDGDEIIELGYKAYDKDIKFGIKNTKEDYLDSLLWWLLGKGELITSTEPTKKYECKIYKELDLERLCKFKKGVIRLHTQPYKYLVGEMEIKWNGPDKLVKVRNHGNAEALPVITVQGSGKVNISLDGTFACRINLQDNDMIIMDAGKTEAHNNGILRNRDMMGRFITLSPGKHEITWDGDITSLTITPRSRWA